MLTEKELLEIIPKIEADNIERTISVREDKLGPAVCALSNDYPNHKTPGYILLGVNDDGTLAGMSFGDEELRTIGGVRSNGNVLPQPSMVVSQIFNLKGGDVIVIEVFPSLYPPVRFKGVCWIRVGPRKAIANETDERRLSEKRTSLAKTFDTRPCAGSKLEDLNIDLFKTNYLSEAIDKETLAKNNRTAKEQLSSLRLYDLVYDCPTNAGILTFGINPLFYISGAYLQIVSFPGKEVSPSPNYEKKFSGALVTELKNIDEFMTHNFVKSKPVQGEGFREEQLTNYPVWALRELLMNAIMHRDYESNAPIYIYEFEDRIEIVNPGGLYGDATPNNFPHTSDYRNPVIAEVLKNLGYVNRFNVGVKNAQTELKKNGNPEAEFKLDLITKFHVTIKNKK